MATAGKPILRGLHNATIKRNLVGMVLTVAGVLTAFNFLVKRPRKEQYALFYKNYDAEKAAERMREAGLFQSTPPLATNPKYFK